MVKFKECFDLDGRAKKLSCYDFKFDINRAYLNNDRILYSLVGTVDNLKEKSCYEVINISLCTDDINQILALRDELKIINDKYQDSNIEYLVEVVKENDTYRIIQTIV